MKNKEIKYPRTFHLPWSPGMTNDDKMMKSLIQFKNEEVLVMEKRDGENTTMTPDKVHARSLDSKDHYTRHFVKQLHANIKYLIPPNYRICGENLHYAKSIRYNNLSDYFEVFSIWNGEKCLSWNDTVKLCKFLGLYTVPVFYEAIFNEEQIKSTFVDIEQMEGYIVRLKDSFSYHTFNMCVGKFVRENHVQTDDHWMNKTNLKKNNLKGK